LKLDDCDIGYKGKLLGNVLARNSTLYNLHLQDSSISAEGATFVDKELIKMEHYKHWIFLANLYWKMKELIIVGCT